MPPAAACVQFNLLLFRFRSILVSLYKSVGSLLALPCRYRLPCDVVVGIKITVIIYSLAEVDPPLAGRSRDCGDVVVYDSVVNLFFLGYNK